MNKIKKTCDYCDSIEFITMPNQYDIYILFEGRLECRRSEYTDE